MIRGAKCFKIDLIMFGGEIFSHLLVAVIYFLAVVVLRGKIDTNLLWIWLGVFVGTFLLDIDHFIYWFVTHPEKEDSKLAGVIWRTKGNRGFEEFYHLLKNCHSSHDRLIFHSVVFQTVLLLLAFYVLSSGGNLFASAFILAMNLHLLKDEWQDYFRSPARLSNWLFWQVRGINTEKYLDFYLTAASLIFLLLTVFIL